MRYDYYCDDSGLVVEVHHGINENLENWEELSRRAGISLGDTPPEAPVRRLISGGNLWLSKSVPSASEPETPKSKHTSACPCCH